MSYPPRLCHWIPRDDIFYISLLPGGIFHCCQGGISLPPGEYFIAAWGDIFYIPLLPGGYFIAARGIFHCCLGDISLLPGAIFYESKFILDSFYESKFILDSFIFWVFPARFLRWFAANVDFSTRSRVCTCDMFGINQGRFYKPLAFNVDFFPRSHDFSVMKFHYC